MPRLVEVRFVNILRTEIKNTTNLSFCNLAFYFILLREGTEKLRDKKLKEEEEERKKTEKMKTKKKYELFIPDAFFEYFSAWIEAKTQKNVQNETKKGFIH